MVTLVRATRDLSVSEGGWVRCVAGVRGGWVRCVAGVQGLGEVCCGCAKGLGEGFDDAGD